MKDMTERDESDSAGTNFNYYATLKELGDNLLRKNVADMKFLCRDLLSKAELEEVLKAIDLFTSLQNVGMISIDKWPGIIPELLLRIRRYDLLRKFFARTPDAIEQQLSRTKPKISPYRTMLFSLSEEVTQSDFKSLKFMCNTCFSKNELNDMKDMQSLLIALEDINELHQDKLGFLLTILKNARITAAQHKLESYLGMPVEKIPMDKPKPVNFQAKGYPPPSAFQPSGSLESLHQPPSYNTAMQKNIQQQILKPPAYFASNTPPTARTTKPALVEVKGGRGDPNFARSTGPREVWARQEGHYQNVLPVAEPSMETLSGQTAALPATAGRYQTAALPATAGRYQTAALPATAGRYQTAAGPATVGHHRQSQAEVEQITRQMARLDPPHLEMPRYEMNSDPRGICVIINNRDFHQEGTNSKKLEDRKGTDVDREKLRDVFEWLGFVTYTYNNLVSPQMVDTLRDIARRDHAKYSCFVCCILSHGESGVIYGSDGNPVEINDLTSQFKSISCPGLAGKPKLFFMQSCQGTDRMGTVESDDVRTDAAYVPSHSIPSEADYLLGLATVPGYVSFRSTSAGSWYISALVEALRNYAHNHDLLSILALVNNQVSQATANLPNFPGKKQVPAPLFTLRKQIFLTPPPYTP